MTAIVDTRSYLAKLKVTNLGCIGPEGLEVSLDEIVCLVGANNCGKSTVLRAYELAATNAAVRADEVFSKDSTKHPGFIKQAPTVELWVHIPDGAENIDSKWKEPADGMLLVRSKWTWPVEGGKPIRTTWDPELRDYAEDGKASGLDTVFNSRLPRPFRIGSLDDPAEEHQRLLEFVLDPIKTRLASLMADEGSALREKILALQAEAEKPVGEFKTELEAVQSRVNASYRRVFSAAEIRLSVSLGELTIDPGLALAKSSHLGVVDSHGVTKWSQQGTGSQRTLFWSMLEVRSELNRLADTRKSRDRQVAKCDGELKKLRAKLAKTTKEQERNTLEESIKSLETQSSELRSTEANPQESHGFLPGFMLLIDEPETALHPSAIRAAKDYLYSLAAEAGWQVMLSTHHPAFIDALKDHTTIVRLHRPEAHAPPNVYRSDSATFSFDEKQTLKALLAFDPSVAEMFFANKVIIVEGDTEFASFTVVMDADPESFPADERPLLLRARGKWTIPLLVRMLAHFKVPCAVLHDVDAPKVGVSGRNNGAYSANEEITRAVNAARSLGIAVIHRCSVPDFERKHGMALPSKDKPFEAWKAVRNSEDIRSSVRSVLDELCRIPSIGDENHQDDGRHYEDKCKSWAASSAPNDPQFDFE